jgi:tRNA pseudouridine38-40 synthase
VTWSYRELDATKMHLAAQALVGQHDFTSYRTVACQAKSPVRTMHSCDVSRRGDFIIIDVEADGFLHHMVRNIAGVLMEVGAGAADIGWVKEVLEAKDRTKGGVTAPPYGLYLYSISYPEEFSIPQLSPQSLVW